MRPSSERGTRRAATRPRLRVLGVVAAIAAGIAIGAQQTRVIDGLEHDSLRARFSLRDAPHHNDVVVVGIDDATFAELKQQWPFKRSLHGRVIDRLHAAGALEIVYDVQFTEPTTPREDGALYDALVRSGGAVLVTGESDGHGHTNVLGGDANLRAAHSRAAAGNLVNDPSGAITQFQRSVGGVDSVPVATAERATGRPPAPGSFAGGKAWIDYRGGPGAIRTVPFAAVLRGRFDPAWFRGKVVVVGATTPTLQDVHPTPVGGSELMAGAEVEANAIATALEGDPLRSAPQATGWLLVALMALVAPLLRLRLGIVASTAAAALAGCAYVVAVQLAFDSGTVLTAVGPPLALVTGAVGTIVASHLAESFERRRVSRGNAILEAKVQERTAELRDTQLEVIRRLGAAVESRDRETAAHISRMSRLCHRLALATGMEPAEADRLRHASAMHDIGKIGIPDRILQKPGKLDADEWEVMKTHTTVGAHILSGSRAPLIRMAETIALTHHERWDGSGYPYGIAGEQIPLVGRITSVCDVFDALISARPYKHAWTVDEALAEIARQSGRQFDPGLVEPFLALARDTPPIPAEPDLSAFPAELLLAPRPEADRGQT
jgi:HD-GYP domain-containing protein (c-di-GMP phosphodiesterase class II)